MDRMHLPELKIDDFDAPQNKIRENFSKSRTYRKFVNSQSENIKNELKKITERIVKKLSEETVKDGLRVENILKELESGEIRNLSIKITDLNFIKFNPSKIRIIIFSMRNYISTLSSLTFNSMKVNKINGNIFAFLILVAYAGFEIRLQELDQISILFYGFIVFIVTQSCVFLINKIHDKTKINFFISSFVIYIVNILILIYVGINLSNSNFTGSINFSNLNIVFSLFFLYLSVFVLNHLIQTGVISSNDILSFQKILILNQNIEREMLWEQYLLIGTKWSVHIHGKVQTRISAAALAIKQDLLKDNQLGIKSTIHTLIDLLKSREIYLTILNRNLEEEIDARLAPWNGIVEIDTVIDEGIANSVGEWVRVVGEVIEEVISNAVRHGGATEIRIEVRPVSKSTLLIYSEDNSPQLPPEALNIKKVSGLQFLLQLRWEIGNYREIKSEQKPYFNFG
jgi:two-component sensor histidine kinase